MYNNQPAESNIKNIGTQTLNSANNLNGQTYNHNRNSETTPRYNHDQEFERRPTPSASNNNDFGWEQPTTKRSTYFQGDLPFLNSETVSFK